MKAKPNATGASQTWLGESNGIQTVLLTIFMIPKQQVLLVGMSPAHAAPPPQLVSCASAQTAGCAVAGGTQAERQQAENASATVAVCVDVLDLPLAGAGLSAPIKSLRLQRWYSCGNSVPTLIELSTAHWV